MNGVAKRKPRPKDTGQHLREVIVALVFILRYRNLVVINRFAIEAYSRDTLACSVRKPLTFFELGFSV